MQGFKKSFPFVEASSRSFIISDFSEDVIPFDSVDEHFALLGEDDSANDQSFMRRQLSIGELVIDQFESDGHRKIISSCNEKLNKQNISMFWQNRITSLIYRIFVLGCAIATLVMLSICYGSTGTWLFGRCDFIIAILAIVVLIAEITINAIDLKRRGINGQVAPVWPALVLALVIYEASDVLVYLMSRSIALQPYLIAGSEVMTIFAHLLLPILILIDWVFFAEKATIKWSHFFAILFFPLAYCLAYFVLEMIMQSSAQTLMYVSSTTFAVGESFPEWMRQGAGMAGVGFVTGLCFLIFALVTILFIFISGLVAGKFHKKYSFK